MTRCIVTFTADEDDYKHRGDSGVYPEKPQIFRTKYVTEYVDKEIKERLEESLCEEEIPTIKPEYLNHTSLMELYNAIAVGEFIHCKFDLKISKSTVRT